MKQSKYVIGVDIGTTSTKSVLFTEKGDTVAQSSVSYPLYSPTPEAAEQDPEQIFSAVVKTVQKVVADSEINNGEIACLSFSAAMHSLIAIDARGNPLTNSITWADNRSRQRAQQVKQQQGENIEQRTGVPIHAMLPSMKLLWLRQERAEVFEKAAKFVSIKEYVFGKLFGEYVVDYAIAAATGLFNLLTLDWDAEMLDLVGISAEKLSQLVPTTYVISSWQAEYASVMGVKANTPVVIGASDGVLSNLGLGAIAPGAVAVTIGTSGAVRAAVSEPITGSQTQLFCYPLIEKRWIVGGAVNNGGIALRWLKDNLAQAEVETANLLGKDAYETISAIAATVPPGAEGVIFHPYLAGERSPLWNSRARASFWGLTLDHTKAHLFRAVFEGVIYNLYQVWQSLQTVAGETKVIRAGGGFTRSALVRQILADIFERNITFAQIEDACLGAATLGLYALELIPSLESVCDVIDDTCQYQPISEHIEIYRQIMPIYGRLLPAFCREYENITNQ